MPNRSRKSSKLTASHKATKRFTLSPESVNFLEAEKLKRGQESASSVLEEIIHECRRKEDTTNIDAAISAYYDSLSDQEREESKHWGEFAESQFPRD
jgi:hypothetical protein